MSTTMFSDEVEVTLAAIGLAYQKARRKHAPMKSAHEGYAIILEEVDELWDEVKAWQPVAFPKSDDDNSLYHRKRADNIAAMHKEALHVAAMALSFLLEVEK